MSSGSPTIGQAATSHGDAPERAAALRAALARSSPWLLAAAGYLILAVMVTWPVAADPTETVFGHPGDSTGNITLLRYRNDLGVTPVSNAPTPLENAPFGLTLPGVTSVPQVAVEGPTQLVGLVTGSEVLAYNLAVMGGLALTALACFALCFHITRNWWAAAVAGLAYGFNPWIVERAAGHVHFTWLWSIALLALGLMLIREGRGRWAWALALGALVVSLYTNTYFALFAGVVIAAFIVADVGAALFRRGPGRTRAALTRGGLMAGAYVLALLPQAAVVVTQGDRIDGLLAGTRSPGDLLVYGSRWYEWLVPSDRHPVFDTWTAPFRYARLHGSNPGETVLYLSVVLLAFALLGLAVTLLVRRRPGARTWPALFGLTLIVLGVFTSLPSRLEILGVPMRAPSSIINDVVEPWRVYARLVAVVLLGVAMLAAMGIAWMLDRLPARTVPLAGLAVGALVAFDLSATQTTFATEPPAIYRALAAQPGDDPRVEYPLTVPASAEHLSYIFQTEAAGKPLVNGGRIGSEGASLQGRIQDPSRPWVAPALAALGVRWVIVHGSAYPEPPPLDPSDYRLVATEGTDRLYEVVAAPAPVVAFPGDGFGGAEPAPGGRAQQWLQSEDGDIVVLNDRDRAVDAVLSFRLASFGRPRRADVRVADEVLASRRVDARPRLVTVPVKLPEGWTTLRLTTDRPPESIDAALGNGDPRSVSLRITGVTIRTPGADPLRLG